MTSVARALAGELRRQYPDIRAEVSRAGEGYRVRLPRSTAQEIGAVLLPRDQGRTVAPDFDRASGLLSQWAGIPVRVTGVRLMRPRMDRGERYEITLEEGAAGKNGRLMKLWRGNLAGQAFEVPMDELAEGFLASPYARGEWPLDRALPMYLSDPAGVNGAWDSQADYTALQRLVRERMTEERG